MLAAIGNVVTFVLSLVGLAGGLCGLYAFYRLHLQGALIRVLVLRAPGGWVVHGGGRSREQAVARPKLRELSVTVSAACPVAIVNDGYHAGVLLDVDISSGSVPEHWRLGGILSAPGSPHQRVPEVMPVRAQTTEVYELEVSLSRDEVDRETAIRELRRSDKIHLSLTYQLRSGIRGRTRQQRVSTVVDCADVEGPVTHFFDEFHFGDR